MKQIPQRRFDAAVLAPASKSVTARAILLAAMTPGETLLENLLDCDDSRYMMEAVRKVGWKMRGSLREGLVIGERESASAFEIELFVGNAGTAMRFLTGWLAFTPGRFILRGEARMHERPIGELVDAIHTLGSEAEYLENEGFPPIGLRGRRMRGGFGLEIEGERSSQFVSALMIGGATLPDGLVLKVTSLASRPYVELTGSMLREFGVSVTEPSLNLFSIQGPTRPRERYSVEGDWSSASYWFAAAAVTGGRAEVSGLRLDSAQGDRRFLELLRAMGAGVTEQGASVVVRGGAMRGGSFDLNSMPDVVPTLAAIAPAASGPVEITNVAHLRFKESDRLSVLAGELRKLGVRVDEREDGLLIQPGWGHDPAVIDPHDDHRMAMSFAIAGLARGGVSIDREQVVSKSYPRFWRTLEEATAG